MGSTLFRNLGLGNLDLGIVLLGLAGVVLILVALLIVILVRFAKLSKAYKKFMQGNTARSLEEDIIRLYEDTKYVKLAVESNRKDVAKLFDKVAKSFQKVGLVKYDAFNQMGGKLSFSIALLDEVNDGFILNSVHSVDGCYTYTKEIKGGVSSIHLGDEEKEALEIAIKRMM